MDTKQWQENKLSLSFLIFFFFSLHFNPRGTLILPENVFPWSILCFPWQTALAQPFPLALCLRSISALLCQTCSSFEPCLSLRLKLRRWWFTGRASSLPQIPTFVPALLWLFLKQNQSLGLWTTAPHCEMTVPLVTAMSSHSLYLLVWPSFPLTQKHCSTKGRDGSTSKSLSYKGSGFIFIWAEIFFLKQDFKTP